MLKDDEQILTVLSDIKKAKSNINPVIIAEAYADLKKSKKLKYSQLSELVNCPISSLRKFNMINNLNDMEKKYIVKNNFSFRQVMDWIAKFSEDERLQQISGGTFKGTSQKSDKPLFTQSKNKIKINATITLNGKNKTNFENIKKELYGLIDIIEQLTQNYDGK